LPTVKRDSQLALLGWNFLSREEHWMGKKIKWIKSHIRKNLSFLLNYSLYKRMPAMSKLSEILKF